MPKCYKCKKKILYLEYEKHIIEKGKFSIGGGYEGDSFDQIEVEYSCPKCLQVLFNFEINACKFLKTSESLNEKNRIQ